jgi:hypothetical protein
VVERLRAFRHVGFFLATREGYESEKASKMKKLVVVVVLLLAGFAGLGFYRGWFTLSTENADHKPSATITVDKDKIQEDEQRAKEKVRGFGQGAKEKTGEQAEKVQ